MLNRFVGGVIGAVATLFLVACTSAQPESAVSQVAQDPGFSPLSREGIAQRIQAGELDASPLFLPTAERRVVFANTDYFAPVRGIVPNETVYALSPQPTDFTDLTYVVEGQSYSLGSFLEQASLMGMMVVQGHDVLLEHYAPDHGPTSRWISFSVTKSVTSLLIGAAVQDGYITSIDAKVTAYIPRLRGSPYDAVSIRDLLHMGSGVAWNEDYTDENSDVAKAGAANGVPLTKHLKTLPKEHEPGTVFNYNTGEANLTGEVLRSAIGNNAATYITAKIWQPFGMEYDATWLTDVAGGGETGGCCISATLGDYARLGLFALNDGVLEDGTRVLPEGWMQDSTTPFVGQENYGYLWWLYPDGRYTASGIFGQKIFVDPQTGTVIAVHSNAESATGSEYAKHLNAALLAITDVIRAGGK